MEYKKCIYYGDCPFNYCECEEDEPFFRCPDRKIGQLKCCADCSCEELMQPCEACGNFAKKESHKYINQNI